MSSKLVVDLRDLEDDDAAPAAKSPTLKRKLPAVAKPALSGDTVNQNIRSGEFVLRKKDGRADFWKNFAEVVDAADGTATEYIACCKCKTAFKHARATGTTHLTEHTKTCAESADQPKMDAFVTAAVSADAKRAIAKAMASWGINEI
ncbi:hypothetical protein BV898_17351 [Hypsibius exemplaris]|uniref:BED-type domain-containing protein n=1 Tax=Hypsibius exemplaris TaxID=2072580 RepID=A0A9X6RM23_HYPEX|nr:hypothetical protein BV898_17351 [Hypsibius exemplaris]